MVLIGDFSCQGIQINQLNTVEYNGRAEKAWIVGLLPPASPQVRRS